ncbi:MAG: Rap1a/Tai family immunity protein [Pseudomonadota bacterium]
MNRFSRTKVKATPDAKQAVALLGLAVVALFLLAPGTSKAIEPVTTEQLNGYCANYETEPDSAQSTICVRYIQGFIAGAIATDDRVARNVAREISGNDNFINNFASVRYGRKQREYEPTYFAEFCVPEAVPLKEVVLKVKRDIRDPIYIAEEKLARDAVYRALRQDYACEQ